MANPNLWFDRNPPQYSLGMWSWVRDNLPLAMSTFKNVDLISLAYDTGFPATGLDIINILVENPAHPQKGIMVHETNSELNAQMMKALEKVSYIPRYTSADNGKTYDEI